MATSTITTTNRHRRISVLDTNLVVITVGADFSKVTIWFEDFAGYVQVTPTPTAAAPDADAVSLANGQSIEVLREDATSNAVGEWVVGVAGTDVSPPSVFCIWGTQNVKKAGVS